MDIKVILAICFYNSQSFIVIIYAHVLVFLEDNCLVEFIDF